MKWRDVILGAMMSLFVSVLGGVLVWLMTVKQTITEEKLTYSIEEAASFATGPGRIGIVTIKIANIGTKAAHDVRGIFVLPSGVEIKSKQIGMSSGPAGSFQDNSKDVRSLSLALPSFAPNETLTTSLLVEGVGSFKPDVGLRSDDSVGTESNSEKAQKTAKDTQWNWWDVSRSTLPVLASLFLLFLQRSRLKPLFPSVSVNNTAFVYLQQKRVEEAKQMLQSKARQEGMGAYETANLALAMGLSGDIEGATSLFKIAEWLGGSKHFQAVVAYNRATLAASLGDYSMSKEKLREAVALSRTAISDYFNLSAYFAEANKSDPEFKTIEI